MREFQDLFGKALLNLCEKKSNQDPWIQKFIHSESANDSADWFITDENIKEEIDRNDGIVLSFNFALCWLRTEILQMKS